MSYNLDREQEAAASHFAGPVKLAVIGVMLSAFGAYILWGIGGTLLACGAVLLVISGAVIAMRLGSSILRERLPRRPTNRH